MQVLGEVKLFLNGFMTGVMLGGCCRGIGIRELSKKINPIQ